MALFIAICTVFSTALGGVVALRARDRMHLVLGVSAGVLLGLVAFDLLPEIFRLWSTTSGADQKVPWTMVAFVGGFLALHVIERAAGMHEPADHDYGDHAHDLAGSLGALGLIAHSLLDGLAIGLAFQVNASVGWTVGIAVLAHDFADGLTPVTLMRRAGHDRRRAMIALGFDALAPVLGVLLASFLNLSDQFLALYLGGFAGLLTYLATADILPEAHAHHPSRITMLMTVIGVAFMYVVSVFS